MPLEDMDVALIDLGDPWVVIPQVRKMLKGSGICIFAICPTMNQLEKLTMALVENEFTDIESTEHIIANILKLEREKQDIHSKVLVIRHTFVLQEKHFLVDPKNLLKNQKLLKLRKSCLLKQPKNQPQKQ